MSSIICSKPEYATAWVGSQLTMAMEGVTFSVSIHLDELVKSKSEANGLAIIVANEYSCRKDHEILTGTVNDLHAAREAFETLKFATLPIRNASTTEIIDVVRTASRYSYPLCYKRLAFVFSGHGDGECVYARDGKVSIQKNILNPFTPNDSPSLAHIPKLFFFDACRGDAVDQGMIVTLQTSGAVAKGSRIPSYGNYLLAYSTMPSMKAFEEPMTGGYWIQHLTKELCNEDNLDRSLGDILTKVNGKVVTEMSQRCLNIQQPIIETTLHQSIYLLREARNAGM